MLESFRNLFKGGSAVRARYCDDQCRLAESLLKENKVGEAAAIYAAVLEIDAKHEPALVGLGGASLRSGDLAKAIRLYDEALKLNSGSAEAHFKRANAYNRLNEPDRALTDYDAAIACDPNYAFAFCNRGTVLERLGRLDEAMSSYDRAIELAPGDAFSQYNRASVLKSQFRHAEALQGYERAISLNSTYTEAYVNRGFVLMELVRHADALSSFDRALSLRPDLIQALQGRAECLLNLKRLEEANTAFDVLLNMKPDQPYVRGLRAYARMQLCDWKEYAEEVGTIETALCAGEKVSTPFAAVALLDSPTLQLRAAQIWVQDTCEALPPLDQIDTQRQPAKIRIGYFSPDFRTHPVAALLINVLERHDRSRFELFAFDFGPRVEDELNARLRKSFDQFLDVRAISDREVAILSRKMAIDIAVDLAGFTEYNRARIFAFRAAPVQVSYLGYPATTGSGLIDFFISDRRVSPPAVQGAYAERLAYLANCVLPIAERRTQAAPARQSLGLPASGFVFCSFNNSWKINPVIFDVWMRILRRVQNSVLWLSATGDRATENLRREAQRRGIDPQRLLFAERTRSHAAHVARLGAADLFLDTFPYASHATGIDALCAGVPLVTCRGASFAARVPASLLTSFGVQDLVADNLTDYENLAVGLALDNDRLKAFAARLASVSNEAEVALSLDNYVRDLEKVFCECLATPS